MSANAVLQLVSEYLEQLACLRLEDLHLARGEDLLPSLGA
jgi:hypothetical protein